MPQWQNPYTGATGGQGDPLPPQGGGNPRERFDPGAGTRLNEGRDGQRMISDRNMPPNYTGWVSSDAGGPYYYENGKNIPGKTYPGGGNQFNEGRDGQRRFDPNAPDPSELLGNPGYRRNPFGRRPGGPHRMPPPWMRGRGGRGGGVPPWMRGGGRPPIDWDKIMTTGGAASGHGGGGFREGGGGMEQGGPWEKWAPRPDNSQAMLKYMGY